MEIHIEQCAPLDNYWLRMQLAQDGRGQAILTIRVLGKCADVVIHGVHPSILREAIPPWGVTVPWAARIGEINSSIKPFHKALEAFREEWSGNYLDVTDDRLEFQQRLERFQPIRDWSGLPDEVSEEARLRWEAARTSPELRKLAIEGRRLYTLFFRQNPVLQKWMDELPAGSRLRIRWPDEVGVQHPSIPWPMLYAGDNPDQAGPVDPGQFLGLRFRLEFTRSEPGQSLALGDPNEVYRGHLFFWRGSNQLAELAEAKSQLEAWQSQGKFHAVPTSLPPADTDRDLDIKKRARDLLQSAEPSPMGLIYVYCQCDLNQGVPTLCFGNPNGPEVRIEEDELPDPASSYVSECAPLVFLNACSTSAPGDVGMANLLEANFLNRGCRGYLGTINRVPTHVASRFAQAFFHFFLAREGYTPLSAGESVSQARLFLWTHYRNISGLYYHYLNDHDIYMLDKIDPMQLRSVSHSSVPRD